MFRSDKTAEYAASLLGGKVTRRENDYHKLSNIPDADEKNIGGNDVINDAFFAGLFIVNAFVIVLIALIYGLSALTSESPQTIHVQDDGSHITLHAPKYMVPFLCGMVMLCFVAAILSLGMVYVMSIFAENVILYSVCIIIGIAVVVGVLLITLEISVGGWLILVFACMAGVFLYTIRPRLHFASINLKTACTAISTMPKIYYYAGMVYGVEIIYCLIWALAAYGLSTNAARDTLSYHGHTYGLDQCTTYVYSGSAVINDISLMCGGTTASAYNCKACFCGGGGGDNTASATLVRYSACHNDKIFIWVYVFMLVSILWACSVFSNIIHCTAAGSVAMWWKHGSSANNSLNHLSVQHDLPTSSFINAITTDIGSICYGSLFVAIVKGMRNVTMFLIRQMEALQKSSYVNRNALGSCCSMLSVYIMKIFEYVLLIIDYLLEYFNRYAFTYVSVYGYEFTRASKSVVSLFRDRGWDGIINDDIIDSVMFFCNITIGILTMAIGMLYTRTVIPNISNVDCIIFDIIAFTVGYGLGMVSLKIICAAVACIYVCFAEHPESFEEAQPALYFELLSAWEQMYPTTNISRERLAMDMEDSCGVGGSGGRHHQSHSQTAPAPQKAAASDPSFDYFKAMEGVLSAAGSAGATLITKLMHKTDPDAPDAAAPGATTTATSSLPSMAGMGSMLTNMLHQSPTSTEQYQFQYVPPVSSPNREHNSHSHPDAVADSEQEYDEMTFSL